MDGKPPFDPSQPFQAVDSKPPFDPSQPFEAAPVAAAAAAPAAEPNADVSATRSVTQGATGFNEGLASSLLRPLDVVPFLISKAMGGEGVHPFEGTFREHFVDPMGDPQNRVEQTLRAGGRMAGENLPLMATGAGVAGSAARSGVTMAEQAAPGIVNKIRGAGDAVLEGMAANPVASAVGENVGAAVSGAGGNIGRNVAKDAGGSEHQQEAAELAGQLLLPSTAAAYSKVSPTRLAAKGVKMAGEKVLDNIPEAAIPEQLRPAGGTYAERKAEQLAYSNREGKYADPNAPAPNPPNFATRRMDAGQAKREDAAAEAASKEFKGIVDQPDAAANLAEAERLQQTIPGFQPGVAKATNDPALLKLQDSMESRATGDELRGVQQAHDANVEAIRGAKDNIIPPAEAPRRTPEQVGPQPATETPQDVVAGAVGQRVQGVNDKIEQRAAGVRQKIGEVSDSLPETDPSAVGTYLRDTRKSLKGEADAQMSELRRGVGDGTVTIKGDKPENDITMSVNQALDRRAQINQDLADHYNASNRDVAATREIRRLQAEKETLDSAIGESSDAGAPGLKAYNDYYRNEYAPRFLQGASREVGRFNRNGYEGNRVASEDVPGKFFAPNNISEARQFNKLYGEDAGARQQMTDHALDDLRRTTVDPNTGQIKEGAVNKWLAKNERILNEMPWVRDAVKAKNPDDLYARLGQLEQRQRAVADTKVAKLLNQGKNPEQHIDAALNDWQVMKGLRNSVRGDPSAEAALRRSVMDRAPDPMDTAKFEAWLKGNDRSLRQVLEPTHLKALQDVLSAAKINGRLPRPTGSVDLPGSLADKGAKVFGITVPSLLQRMLSVKQGRMSAEYGVADVGVRALRQFSNREIEGAWKEALYNPKVAKDLQLIVKGGGATPIQLARMRNYLLSVGLHDAEDRAKH
jgi:hypothetical protein